MNRAELKTHAWKVYQRGQREKNADLAMMGWLIHCACRQGDPMTEIRKSNLYHKIIEVTP